MSRAFVGEPEQWGDPGYRIAPRRSAPLKGCKPDTSRAVALATAAEPRPWSRVGGQVVLTHSQDGSR